MEFFRSSWTVYAERRDVNRLLSRKSKNSKKFKKKIQKKKKKFKKNPKKFRKKKFKKIQKNSKIQKKKENSLFHHQKAHLVLFISFSNNLKSSHRARSNLTPGHSKDISRVVSSKFDGELFSRSITVLANE